MLYDSNVLGSGWGAVMEQASHCDIAVIGAGPAGSLCARSALKAHPGLQVALVDRDVFPREKSCGDLVRYMAKDALKSLGLGGVFDGRSPLAQRSVTFPANFGYLKQYFKGRDPVFVIERKIFDHFLFNAAIHLGASDFSGHKFIDAVYKEASDDWLLHLEARSGKVVKLRCKTLVGADGAGSRVRRMAGLDCHVPQHTSVALRGYAQVDGLSDQEIRLDYLDSFLPGYGWAFPMAHGKMNLGVILDKVSFKRKDRPLKSYLDEYLNVLRDKGADIGPVDNIMAHPLPLASEQPNLLPRRNLALIGDAGSMINPITGEGIHFALWAGKTLGSLIAEQVRRGESVQNGLNRFRDAHVRQLSRPMQRAGQLFHQVRTHKFIGW